VAEQNVVGAIHFLPSGGIKYFLEIYVFYPVAE